MLERLHRTLKLSSHKHTGKHLSHPSTSHGVIIALLLLTGGVLVLATQAVSVSASSESGSVTLNGSVSGLPPQTPAIIEQPVSDQIFTSPWITVSGTCPNDSFVQIFRNGIFAGTAACKDGRFNLKIDLVIGKNKLTAKVYDNLGQFGPDSALVIVFYEPKKSPLGSSNEVSPSNQLIVTAESFYLGVPAGKKFGYNILVLGGKASYAVIIEWGDGTNSVFARESAGQFVVNHSYRNGGIYKVTIEVTDQAGSKATLKTIILVNGEPKLIANTIRLPPPDEPLLWTIIWPLYLMSLVMVSSFWLGERYKLHQLKHAGKLKIS